jgi:hypothetical protein
MVKFSSMLTATALATATVSAVDPSVTLSSAGVNVAFQLASNLEGELNYLNAGSCDESSSSAVFAVTDDGSGNGDYTLDLDITACNLVMGTNVTFMIGGSDTDDAGDEVKLTFYEYMFTLDEEYTYTITYSYGKVSTNTTVLTPNDLGVTFTFQAYDAAYATANNLDDRMAGDFIYLGLTIDEPAAFDHDAYNFAITNCKIRPVGGSVEYTFFDHSRDTCSNDMIGLDVSYDTAGHMWRLSHMLFLLNGASGDELEIECEAKVCPAALHGSSCLAVATSCLDCKTTPLACQNNGYCQSTDDFAGAYCHCVELAIDAGAGVTQHVGTVGDACEFIRTCDISGALLCGDGECIDNTATGVPFTLNGVSYGATGTDCDCPDGFLDTLGCLIPSP